MTTEQPEQKCISKLCTASTKKKILTLFYCWETISFIFVAFLSPITQYSKKNAPLVSSLVTDCVAMFCIPKWSHYNRLFRSILWHKHKYCCHWGAVVHWNHPPTVDVFIVVPRQCSSGLCGSLWCLVNRIPSTAGKTWLLVYVASAFTQAMALTKTKYFIWEGFGDAFQWVFHLCLFWNVGKEHGAKDSSGE